MKKISIDFEYCYGIKGLKHSFDFEDVEGRKRNACSIYAPNGVMKTSFSKTLRDISKGDITKDLVFPERKTKRRVFNSLGNEINKENIFVIEPYNADYDSDKKSTLLVKDELRVKYENIHKNIEDKKNLLLQNMFGFSGITKVETLNQEIESAFKQSFFEIIESLFESVNNSEKMVISKFIYNEIFNTTVFTFLNTSDMGTQIKEYIETFNEVLEKSDFLKQDFNHYNAQTIQKSLKDNGFFKAKHSLNFKNNSTQKEILSETELETVIKEEKAKVMSDPKVLSKFEVIDKKLKNEQLRSFRNYLFKNQDLLPLLSDLEKLKKDLFLSYFLEQKQIFIELYNLYLNGKKDIEEIINEAKKEETAWENVVEIFNERFSIPFKLQIENKEDVILKNSLASVGFLFKDSEGEKEIQKKELIEVLSQGEKRALYLLNIIFEVEARKKQNLETLFIVDDIADSFDYKNKYAIIEYLKDITKSDIFYQIILTHNFDFFRTLESRFVGREQCLIANKMNDKIELEPANYLKNPFDYFKNHLNKDKFLIASIPFIRNLAEYIHGKKSTEYIKLTSLLHFKSDSLDITKEQFAELIKTIVPQKKQIFKLENKDDKILDLVFQVADSIYSDSYEKLNLENKIVLSIAIRLKAEQILIDTIADNIFITSLNSAEASKQTRSLIEKYKEIFFENKHQIETFEKVNLITPENIHLNSFMYEPILDISEHQLKKLYFDLKNLNC